MKLKDMESWLTPTDAAKILTEQGQRITRQGIEKRLNEGRYRAVKTRQGWLIDPVEFLTREAAMRGTHDLSAERMARESRADKAVSADRMARERSAENMADRMSAQKGADEANPERMIRRAQRHG